MLGDESTFLAVNISYYTKHLHFMMTNSLKKHLLFSAAM